MDLAASRSQQVFPLCPCSVAIAARARVAGAGGSAADAEDLSFMGMRALAAVAIDGTVPVAPNPTPWPALGRRPLHVQGRAAPASVAMSKRAQALFAAAGVNVGAAANL